MGLGRLTIKLFYFFDIFPHKQNKMAQEAKFIRIVAQAEIAASGKIELDLNDVRAEFGDNLNTLQITNTDAGGDITIYADGKKMAYVTSNNGSFTFDWESGIVYNFLTIENHNAAAVIAAEKVKVFVGRTGRA